MSLSEKEIDLILNKCSSIITPIIKEVLSYSVDKKYRDIVNYPILTGGKRIRPTLSIIVCQMLGGNLKNVLYPAAGLEIMHNYSLIIDDMIDNGTLRRGKSTAWARFGRSVAQCVAIDYFASIFQAANKSKEPVKISEVLAKTIKILTEGEILDILFEQRGREEESYVVKNRYKKIDMKDYSEMISKKTAALFQSSCEIGGICADADEKQIAALKDYGFNFGMIFQISDDILDILGSQEKFGKKIGKDIEERKGGNIIIHFAMLELSQNEKTELWQILRKRKITQKDINRGIELIKKTKAKEKAEAYCQKFVGNAKENLKLLPRNKWNNILGDIVDYLVKREK